ncbi:MAG: DUF2066 domain-containing protein [Alphaproteobacteria bacterium]
MAQLYKAFCWLGIALICVFSAIEGQAAPNAIDPIFTIEDVQVDVTAQNAILAREKAFEEAQVKAFETLATRMLPEGELAVFELPAPLAISPMIQDFELLNEKLSAVRYVGAYTFRFNDKAVRNFFAKKETTISTVSSRPLLILPYLQRGTANTIWSPYNDWMLAWKRMGQGSDAVPIRLPIGDLEDVKDVEDNKALRLSPENLDNMLNRYGLTEAVIAIAHPDDALHNITNQNAVAKGELSVEIYRTDRGAPELVQQISVIANGVQSKTQLYDAAVLRVKSALKQDWKARTLVKATAPQNRLSVRIPIGGLPDWMSMQKTLRKVQGIEDITVNALTTNEVNADLVFQGDSRRIVTALRQNGLILEQATLPNGETATILRPKGGVPQYKPMTF